MTRREIRDNAFKLIFEYLLRDDPVEVLYEEAKETDEISVNDEVKKLVEGVIEKSGEIDEKIGSFSKTRGIARISRINVAILRIAIYEILYDDLTPVNAAISEAVLLSQKYSYKEDTSFVNGVLSSLAKSLPMEETTANA
ncbi:transcription antitermination factor NusB [Porcipelethomonas sp.]|uniref:transcription antitermination factor NusB n=1 Tax=Porcipelethomonas sp. TaxID=2981675 RepID=UPI003EFB3897